MIDRITALQIASENPGSIFLESAPGNGAERESFLFSQPTQILTTRTSEDVPGLLQQLDDAVNNGFYVAGYLGYECGYGLDPFNEHREYPQQIAWFGIYDKAALVAPKTESKVSALYKIENLQLFPSFQEYDKALATIHELIATGDTYQINYTGQYRFKFSGAASAFYDELLRQQPVKYAAFLNTGQSTILSLSPELFFRRDGNLMTARPMKGTAARGRFPKEDAKIASWLAQDEKSRAENVMIVDLLRNDLSRICLPDTVKVPKLFEIERYRSLFQMTSTITGLLQPNTAYQEIFQALFPCGSVTGAPKIRSMEIIRQLESRIRGVYTGTIGYISPQQKAVFNVPIRTIVLEDDHGKMGTGGGIVWDSDSVAEYRECKLKARFLTDAKPRFQLLETLLWDGKYPFLMQHLQRISQSAEYFDFPLDLAKIEDLLVQKQVDFHPPKRYRVRLLLDEMGRLSCEAIELPEENISSEVIVAFARQPVDSTDRYLYHKTTHRTRYTTAFQRAKDLGLADILFVNEKGHLTEGAISNVFVEKDGELLTPSIECGVLPGIYRQYLLETRHNIVETEISMDDIVTGDAIYICNAVRGLRQVKLSAEIIDI